MDKARVLGTAPPGVFGFLGRYGSGSALPGDWWRVTDGTRTLGYGWVDFNWAEGEVLLAVDSACQGEGVGGFILDHLHQEARARGVNYLYNVIPSAHPEPIRLAHWLEKRGYRSHGDLELRVNLSMHGDDRRAPPTGTSPN
jgi:GNAT superfamily N-acetyltransferase